MKYSFGNPPYCNLTTLVYAIFSRMANPNTRRSTMKHGLRARKLTRAILVLGVSVALTAWSAGSSNSVEAANQSHRLGNPYYQTYCSIVYPGSTAVRSVPGGIENAWSWRCRLKNILPYVPYVYRQIDVGRACVYTYPRNKNVVSKLENSSLGGWFCWGE